MGLEARINAGLWRAVTNKDVAETADPDCAKCGGDGLVLGDDSRPAVCACAKDRFYRTYAGRMRRGEGGLEFKPLVAVP